MDATNVDGVARSLLQLECDHGKNGRRKESIWIIMNRFMGAGRRSALDEGCMIRFYRCIPAFSLRSSLGRFTRTVDMNIS